ncbi:hypothetical protein ABZ234_01125 [Nocardiopsis sp. NPDC006198]|uniref:hypothetical protein n=1 Tax=Nocardiopsis sp. NPDC006198 TaxID=3154472 RepID=UPI00339FCA3A
MHRAALSRSRGLPVPRSERPAAFAAAEGTAFMRRAGRGTAPLRASGEEDHDPPTRVPHPHRDTGEGQSRP